MAPDQQLAMAEKVKSPSPYQLDPEQTLKAATALLAHIKREQEERSAQSEKKNLLADAEDSSDENEEADTESEPVWLLLTTKKFIVDQTKLKPGKMWENPLQLAISPLPYPIHSSKSSTVCLFTADPATPYRDLLKNPAFPPSLAQRISGVIPLTKLKTQYKPFESRRQLLAQYDLFLADDRIITHLPSLLGKTFYKSGSKRPIPVNLSPQPEKVEGKRVKKEKKHALTPRQPASDDKTKVATPADAAKEIEKALSATTVQLSASTSTSVRVGRTGKGWTAEMLRRNVEAVVENLVGKKVPGVWRGVRALYLKGERTASLPIWMTRELWETEGDVLAVEKGSKPQVEGEGLIEEGQESGGDGVGARALEDVQGREETKKRKAGEEGATEGKKRRKKKTAKDGQPGDEAMRKGKLAERKKAAMAALTA
ncbi:MAG: hypothetical protein M1820_005181 [Bogoriella megaspora]|nr:MAG: hypothetical protein M1820_005181 [Bogoriella megaspora]